MSRANVRVKARGLGTQLADLRAQSGMKLREVAGRLGWSPPTLSRIENGLRDSTPEEVAALLVVYKVTGVRHGHLVNLARTIDQPGWWETSASGLPGQLIALCAFEAEATKIGGVSMILVPGLLQTETYMRAMMESAGAPPDSIEARVSTRLGRQAVLARRKPPELHAILDEAALHRRIGSPLIMAEQMRHLIKMAARPNIRVQVIGNSGHAGVDGSYVTLEFPMPAQPFVHLEHMRSSLFLDEPDDVQDFLDTTVKLSGKALSPARSQEYLARLARRYEAELE